MDLADVRSKPVYMTESLKSQELVTTVTNFTRSWSERRLKSSVLVRICLRSTYISKSSPNLRWVSGDTLWRWWRESLSLRGHRHNWPGSGYHSEERVIKGRPHTSYPPPAPLALQCIGREASTQTSSRKVLSGESDTQGLLYSSPAGSSCGEGTDKVPCVLGVSILVSSRGCSFF